MSYSIKKTPDGDNTQDKYDQIVNEFNRVINDTPPVSKALTRRQIVLMRANIQRRIMYLLKTKHIENLSPSMEQKLKDAYNTIEKMRIGMDNKMKRVAYYK